MKNGAQILALLALALGLPARAQDAIPTEVRGVWSKLAPLQDRGPGVCTKRALVWQQQLGRDHDGMTFLNAVVYFSTHHPSPAGTRWGYHIAPAVLYRDAWYVLERSPFISEPMTIEAWVAKLTGSSSNPCRLLNPMEPEAGFTEKFARTDRGTYVETPSANPYCYYAPFHRSIVDPFVFLPVTAHDSDEDTDPEWKAIRSSARDTPYERLLDDCATVLDKRVWKQGWFSIEWKHRKSAYRRALKRCRKLIPADRYLDFSKTN